MKKSKSYMKKGVKLQRQPQAKVPTDTFLIAQMLHYAHHQQSNSNQARAKKF
jgi:hypothetical protein